jgi:hypothetical protein
MHQRSGMVSTARPAELADSNTLAGECKAAPVCFARCPGLQSVCCDLDLIEIVRDRSLSEDPEIDRKLLLRHANS